MFNLLPHNWIFNDPDKIMFQNIVGNGENAGNQHFPLFPQCFLPCRKRILPCKPHLHCHVEML